MDNAIKESLTPIAAGREFLEQNPGQQLVDRRLFEDLLDDAECLVAALKFTRHLYQNVLEQETNLKEAAFEALRSISDHLEQNRTDPSIRSILALLQPDDEEDGLAGEQHHEYQRLTQ